MNRSIVRKTKLHQTVRNNDLSGKTPGELIGLMWQLALDAYSFRKDLDAEPRLQRHVVVLKRGRG
jgi:hypothetical protein